MAETLSHPPSAEINESVQRHSPEMPSSHAQASPNEAIPYYALDEATIRAKVAEALDSQPKPAPLLIYEDQADHKGREQDIDKAQLQAYAEAPYRLAAKAKFDQSEEITENTHLRDTTWARFTLSFFRHPVKAVKAITVETQGLMQLDRGWNAAQIVGTKYDKMVAAAMPYVQKLDVMDVLPDQKKESATQEQAPEAPEASPEAKQLSEQLKLAAQYQEQMHILHQDGILEILSTGELGIKDEKGKEYPAPQPHDVERMVDANRDLIAYKASQGFTRLLLVPDALPLQRMTQIYEERLAARASEGVLHDSDGEQVVFHKQAFEPSETEEKRAIKELPEIKDLPEDSKSPVTTPGWRIVLVKNLPEMPDSRMNVVGLNGRGEFLPGGKPQAYQEALQSSPVLRGESGFTAKMWYTFALTEVERDGTVIDFRYGTLLLGSYVPARLLRRYKEIPQVGWRHAYPKLNTSNQLVFYPGLPREPLLSGGVRTAVELRDR